MPTDYLSTLRQTLPRFFSVIGAMRPTFRFDNVLAITTEWLVARGVEVVLWDVDGTLMSYHGLNIDPLLATHMEHVFGHSAIQHGILSNCDEDRFVVLANMLPAIPILRGYATATGPVCRVRLGETDSHDGEEVRHLTRNGWSQIRKPDPALIRLAADHFGVDRGRMLMVGDQYLTDVAVANLGGCQSVKVSTFHPDTFPNTIRVSQALERTLFRVVNGRS